MKHATLYLLLAAVLLGACAPAATGTPEPIIIPVTFVPAAPSATPEPTKPEPTTPEPTPVGPVSDLTESATYAYTALGFQFDYPAAWGLSDLPEIPYAVVTIYSWDPNARPPKQQEGIPEGGEKMDIVPVNWATYEELIQQRHDEFAGYTYTVEDVTLPGGLTGVLFRVEPRSEGDFAIRVLVTQVNGIPLLMAGLAYEFEYFDAIAFSLRPIP